MTLFENTAFQFSSTSNWVIIRSSEKLLKFRLHQECLGIIKTVIPVFITHRTMCSLLSLQKSMAMKYIYSTQIEIMFRDSTRNPRAPPQRRYNNNNQSWLWVFHMFGTSLKTSQILGHLNPAITWEVGTAFFTCIRGRTPMFSTC